jgi:hypothetical protein
MTAQVEYRVLDNVDMESVGGELVQAKGGALGYKSFGAGVPLPPNDRARLAVPAGKGKKLLESMLTLGSLRLSISGHPL